MDLCLCVCRLMLQKQLSLLLQLMSSRRVSQVAGEQEMNSSVLAGGGGGTELMVMVMMMTVMAVMKQSGKGPANIGQAGRLRMQVSRQPIDNLQNALQQCLRIFLHILLASTDSTRLL